MGRVATGRPRKYLLIVGYVIAAVLLDLASRYFALRSGHAICYPPSGLYLAVILVYGWRALPLAFVSHLFSSLVTFHDQLIPLRTSIPVSLAAMVSPALMLLASRRLGFPRGRFASFAVSMAYVVSAILSVGAECFVAAAGRVLTGASPPGEFSTIALGWWVANVLPYLALTPALLCIFRSPPRIQRHPTAWSMAVAAMSVLAVGIAFSTQGAGQILRLYIVFLPIVLGALVFGDVGGRWANLLVTCSAVMFAPNFLKDPNLIMEAQFFLVIMNMVGLLAGATVDDRRRAEEALRESRQRLALLVEQSPMAVIEWDLNFRVVTWNTAAQAIFGYSAEEALGSHASDLIVPGPLRAHVDRVWMALMTQTGGSRSTNENVTKDGRTIFCEWYNTPLIDEAGMAVGVASLVMDVTDHRRAEEQRKRLQEQLTQAQKMESIGRLAGGVAHDINNMLTPILGYAEMLRSSPTIGAAEEADLEQIIDAGTRCGDLVQQLLAFARRQTLEMKPIDLNRVILDFQKMMRRTLRENITLQIHIGASGSTIFGDAGQVQQILLNLALNAQDAMLEGGKLIVETATVMLDEEYARTHEGVVPGPHVLLAVSDTGIGMDHDTLGRVFDPFFTTKQIGKGTGLGLATVYGIVGQHGGSITVYSEPGKGSTFRIYFPATDRSPRGEQLKPADKTAGGEETILVVEDQHQVRALACRVLREHGYDVLEATSGEEALQVATDQDQQIDLLITDVVMTGMNGKDLHTRLSAERPLIRVLYMSGYTTNVIGHHGVLDAGVDFIQKPFSLGNFLNKVRQVLDRPCLAGAGSPGAGDN